MRTITLSKEQTDELMLTDKTIIKVNYEPVKIELSRNEGYTKREIELLEDKKDQLDRLY